MKFDDNGLMSGIVTKAPIQLVTLSQLVSHDVPGLGDFSASHKIEFRVTCSVSHIQAVLTMQSVL